MFNKFYEENWKEFSKRNGSSFRYITDFRFIDPFLLPPTISLEYKECKVVIDIYRKPRRAGFLADYFTQMKARLTRSIKKAFSLYIPTLAGELLDKLFCFRFLTGDKNFDNRFFIKGHNKEFLHDLFSDSELRELINNQPCPEISIKHDDIWASSIYFKTPGIIYNIDELQNLYNLRNA